MAKMKKEYEQRLEEVKKSQEEVMDDKLDASIKRILQQNRKMAEELKMHMKETDTLQSEVKILEEDRSRLMREMAIKTEMEEGFAKRGAKQGMVIKEAQAKIRNLEGSLQALSQQSKEERQALLQQTQHQLIDAKAEGEALRKLVKIRTRELKNIRRLAHEVLLQRSDVEIFLMSSLHQVRREMERAAVTGTSRGGGPGSESCQLEIKDLPWEDREKILKLLFAQINNQAQQAQLMTLPPHGETKAL